MNYYVVGQDGSKYGPADLNTIIVWINEGRIAANTNIEEAGTGIRQRAVDIPEIAPYLGPAQRMSPPPVSNQPPYSAPSYPGYPRAGDQSYYAPRQPLTVDSHLGKSIFVAICCCQILGIIAIVYSAMASSKASAGDPGAAKDAETADTIGNWGIGLGLVGGILYFLLAVAGGMH